MVSLWDRIISVEMGKEIKLRNKKKNMFVENDLVYSLGPILCLPSHNHVFLPKKMHHRYLDFLTASKRVSIQIDELR
jgi:hypothetical protein